MTIASAAVWQREFDYRVLWVNGQTKNM